MKLKVTHLAANQHKDMATAVGWSFANELVSCSDDKTLWRWSMNAEPVAQLMELDAFVTKLDWFPAIAGKNGRKEQEIFAVACTDGSFKLVNKAGRVEKSVDAHTGAVIALRWNYEGTALATCGEDGAVKVWSRAGMLRATLAQLEQSVYAIAWSPDGDQLLFATDKELIIKPLQPTTKQTQWKAHEGAVTAADWNLVNNLIVSGGEDCRYKIWDVFGRQLFASSPFDFAVTAVKWCPNGGYFAVGSFDAIRLCDRAGWSHAREAVPAGSVLDLAWTSDGTQLAAAGGNGAVCFGQVLDRELSWSHYEVLLTEPTKITVVDVLSDGAETLEFRDRVIEFAMAHGRLVAATAAQCAVYTVPNWHTPHVFDLKESVTMLKLAPRHFALVDNLSGVQIYAYEGRPIAALKFPGFRPEFAAPATLAISNDAAASVDRAQPKVVRFLDCVSGRPSCKDYAHPLDVDEVLLSQAGHAYERKFCVIDGNRDLHLGHVADDADPVKLATMVDSAMWNDDNDMLLAVADGKVLVWYYPQAAYTDRDLLQRTRADQDATHLGKMPACASFHGPRAVVRRSDGALVAVSLSPYPGKLAAFCSAGDWESALRLCRYVRDPSLWACLAAMALSGKDYNAAEVAYAAIEEVDKLKYMLYIKGLPTEESRSAALLAFQRKGADATQVLLQGGLLYRAIKTLIRQHDWEAALQTAVRHQTHVDTVLYYRAEMLRAARREEMHPLYLQYAAQVPVDPEVVRQKVEADKQAERSRPGATPYQ